MPFSFSGFDVPILNLQVGQLFLSEAAADVQLPPVVIPGAEPGYSALVATRTVRCVDEARSEFTRWINSDGRPDKVGEYRMFTHLRLDPAAVPPETDVFRVWGWKQALIVSEPLAKKLRGCVKEGLAYEAVA